MEKKNMMIIAAVVILAIVIVVGFIFISGNSNDSSKGSTSFSSPFMEGSFVGNVSLENDSLDYDHAYKDKAHDIEYNITTMDNASALMEIYEFQGIGTPEKRTFNGQEWNIYFGEAVPNSGDNNSTKSNDTMGIIICEVQKENQGYVINVIFGNNSDVNFTKNTYGDSYIDYVEPLLKSISLKESKDVPSVADQFGLSQDEFNHQIDLIHQYEAGNTSVLEGSV